MTLVLHHPDCAGAGHKLVCCHRIWQKLEIWPKRYIIRKKSDSVHVSVAFLLFFIRSHLRELFSVHQVFSKACTFPTPPQPFTSPISRHTLTPRWPQLSSSPPPTRPPLRLPTLSPPPPAPTQQQRWGSWDAAPPMPPPPPLRSSSGTTSV